MTPVSGPGRPPSFLSLPLDDFLDALSAGEPAPGGGAAAAIAVALGASLCAMTARLSSARFPAAAELAAEAELLRNQAAWLGEADAEAYGHVIEAFRLPKEPGSDARGHAVAAALSAAADVPMRVIDAAAQVARLAARLAEDGNPNLRGDAVTAALLAEAGARAAGALVRINLADAPQDHRLAEVDRLLQEVARSSAETQQPRQ
jgi:methenyltetrahydrofolate cyclohydrolase